MTDGHLELTRHFGGRMVQKACSWSWKKQYQLRWMSTLTVRADHTPVQICLVWHGGGRCLVFKIRHLAAKAHMRSSARYPLDWCSQHIRQEDPRYGVQLVLSLELFGMVFNSCTRDRAGLEEIC